MEAIWTAIASAMGVLAFGQSFLRYYIPPELTSAVTNLLRRIFCYFSSYCYYDIHEDAVLNANKLYEAAQVYLSSIAYAGTTTRLSLRRGVNSASLTYGLSGYERISDCYNGSAVVWEHFVTEPERSNSNRHVQNQKRRFTLRLRKKDKDLVLKPYLDHVMEKANELQRKDEHRWIYTNTSYDPQDSTEWEYVLFKHPSTFDTLAMDPVKKSDIMADLSDFARGESFYQQTGRAWKRGYLLYGPPGTGKSSLIAAIANHLCYNIYDLELSQVKSNLELRRLLMNTTSKSVIVIEDIDCSLDLTNRDKKVVAEKKNENGRNRITLSGLLNFIDGLWSCCGSERIFVFTTNYVERIDPALLRSGRMDMHIHMGNCSFPMLKILMKNYLEFEEKDVGEEFEAVIDAAEITPADVSEVLIKNRRDKKKAVEELLDVLRLKSEKNQSKSNENVGCEEEMLKNASTND